MKRLICAREEDGSIILTVLVILVATGLIVSTVALAESGLRSSRRSGDSANALQVADAGINDAVQRAGTFQGATPPSYCVDAPPAPRTCTPPPVTLPNGGVYQYTATRDTSLPGWRVVSTGTDAAKLVRRIRADLIERSVVGNALFVQANANFAAGAAVDSYTSGLNAATMCTGAGIVGTNDAASMSVGSSGVGGGVTNCRTDRSPNYPYDGCVSYGDDPANFPSASRCPPPPSSTKSSPAFTPDFVFAPPSLGAPVSQPGGECTSTTAPLGASGPRVVYWETVKLRAGCRVDPGGFVIYTRGNVEIGNSTGVAGNVNAPPTPCPTSTLPAGPSGFYCGGWPATLDIRIVSDASPTPNIFMYNHLNFWGVITAPEANLASASGSPQVSMWGAMSLAQVTTNAQFALHYDEALAKGATGTFFIGNWAPEPA